MFLAADPSLESSRAIYWRNCLPVESDRRALRPGDAVRLWELSERLCGISSGSQTGTLWKGTPLAHNGAQHMTPAVPSRGSMRVWADRTPRFGLSPSTLAKSLPAGTTRSHANSSVLAKMCPADLAQTIEAPATTWILRRIYTGGISSMPGAEIESQDEMVPPTLIVLLEVYHVA